MNMKIAMVDADIYFLNYASQCLSRMQNLEINTFCDEQIFIEYHKKINYDVVCMEYELSSCNCYELVKSLQPTETIFIIVSDHCSIHLFKEGLKCNIFRHVSKDNYSKEITEALHSAKDYFMKKGLLQFNIGKEILQFDLKHVLAVYSDKHYICIVLDNDTTKRIRTSLKEIAEQLIENDFAKAECCTYVNLHRILTVDKYRVYLDSNASFCVSKSKFQALKRRYLEVSHVKSTH